VQLMEKIDLTLLPENARKELIDFYEFLMEKYVRNQENMKKESFFSTVKRYSFTLPPNYKFNREELHER